MKTCYESRVQKMVSSGGKQSVLKGNFTDFHASYGSSLETHVYEWF